jgi:lysophospholipase L1-like esterase
MFMDGERRWWPWAPVLLAQGLYARLATTRLQPARDADGRVGDGARTVRLAGLGDSIIAGIGVGSQTEGLVGQVAAQAASRAGVKVHWRVFGQSGATCQAVLEGLLPAAVDFEPELVVLSLGVNDAIAGVKPSEFKQTLRALVEVLASSARRPSIVFGGIPPLGSFPALPWPLSQLLGQRAQALQEAAVQLTGFRGMKVVVFPARLQTAAFSVDRFHPGKKGCGDWAGWVVNGMAHRLEEFAESAVPLQQL